MTGPPLPDRSGISSPYWDALDEGSLVFQVCALCGNTWLPPREECPGCLGSRWTWRAASGRAELLSWVVYHRAFHPYFAERVPYLVAVAQLVEGPRVVTNLVELTAADRAELRIGMPLELVIEREAGLSVARFGVVSSAVSQTEVGQ